MAASLNHLVPIKKKKRKNNKTSINRDIRCKVLK